MIAGVRGAAEEAGAEFTLRYSDDIASRVVSGSGLLDRLGAMIREMGAATPRRVVLCSDSHVLDALGERVRAALRDAGLSWLEVAVPAGEEQKSLETLGSLYGRFAALGVERQDVVVALGGGVVGDLFGFAAASYLRGLPLVQVPTSVVAQVDSSIGGKVGIDLPAGKNLAGAFKHPELVAIDYGALATLPDAEWIAGTAEVLKHGVIADRALFEALERDPSGWRTRSVAPDAILRAAVAVKARVVQEDERETGLRMTLNYGHTLGHALETAVGYRGVRHGEAVAWGMAMAARLAVAAGQSTPAFVQRQDRVLQALGLLAPLPAVEIGRVHDALFRDKKVREGKIRWILPLDQPGAVSIRADVPDEAVRELVAATVAGRLLETMPAR